MTGGEGRGHPQDREARELLRRNFEEALAEYPPPVRRIQSRHADTGEAADRLLQLYVPGGTLVDLGGGVSCTLPALRKSGMRVIVVDSFNRPYYAQDCFRETIALLRATGVEIHEADILECTLDFIDDESVDCAGCFNCLEHLHHSPKDVFEAAVRKLRPAGRFLIGVPNAVNLLKRIRVLCGRTNLCAAGEFYNEDRPFTGHVREWTASELLQLSSWLGLERATVVGRNWFLHSRFPQLPAPVRRVLDGALRPLPGLCSNLQLRARKPAVRAG